MLDKIKMLPVMAYLAVNNFVKDLKNNEKGSSPVVDTVLLILVAVLAVVMVWGFLSGFIQDLWERIISGAGGIA